MTMGKNLKTGEVEACEIGNQIPGQMELNEIEAYNKASEVQEAEDEQYVKTVDPSTGEIYETPVTNKVIDLRTQRAAQ